MTQDTKLQQLVINKLTTAQYQAALNAGTIDPNQLYMTTDSQTLRDVTVGGSSIVSNNTAALGTMALETASNYSTKAVADTLYAQKALETTVAGKLDKISTASKVYGTDVNGNQTSYDITSFGNVDDVKVGTTSVVANKIATLGTMAGQPTTNYYTKTEIDGKLSAGMHYKGTVASYSNLPSSDNQIGDLYNVTDTGSNYAWDGTAWDKMSENIDLSNVVPNTRTINGKELSTNITLSASDVGALPSSTIIPTVDQTYDGTSANAQSGVAINNAKFLRNTATNTESLTIYGDASNRRNTINIGAHSSPTGVNSIMIGAYSKAGEGAFAIGNGATAGNYSLGLLGSATANYAYQIGRGTNIETNSLYVGWANSDNYKLLGSDGKIPDDRLNTTIARTSSLPSIATTSTAGLVKPDGTSITVDANGVISSAAGIEIDNETITQNGDNELQTVAIVNPNTNSGAISPLKIWNGTERQWINGEATVWNYWQTDVQAMWAVGGTLPSNDSWSQIGYGNGRFVVVSYGKSTAAYSDDGGVTWNSATLPSSGGWRVPAYGDGKFVTVASGSKSSAYSTDGGATWTAGGALPNYGNWLQPAYGNGKFVTVKESSNEAAYSDDGGVTWNSATLPSSGVWKVPAYGDGVFVTLMSTTSDIAAYSDDGGVTWNSATLPSSGYWNVCTYGNGNFVALKFNTTEAAYSDDGGVTWNSATLPESTYRKTLIYGNGRFISISSNTYNFNTIYSDDGGVTWNSGGNLPIGGDFTKSFFFNNTFLFSVDGNYTSNMLNVYSTDGGVTWQQGILPSSSRYMGIASGEDRVITTTYNSDASAIFTVQYDKCYTLDSTPTTSSQVYSAPETTSTKTITSVGSGTITLSDNLVYNSTPSGNQNTYRTLGDAHPNWICNINNVGVKIGNTTIATAGGTDVEALTDTEIENLWEE